MRAKVLMFVCALIIAVSAASTAAAYGPAPTPDPLPTRTEVAVLPPADAAGGSKAGTSRTIDDLRDSAALVLVGSMLIGLAAAVRRTA